MGQYKSTKLSKIKKLMAKPENKAYYISESIKIDKAVKEKRLIMKEHPHIGLIIKDLYLDEYNLSNLEFAQKLGVTESTIADLVNGKVGLSKDIAKRIGKSFNGPVKLLLDCQSSYDLWLGMLGDDSKLSEGEL
jgi:addiction module HigA family antidote